MSAAVEAGKYYRVLRTDDSVYRAPGLIRRTQGGRRDDRPLYFTNDIGMLIFAYRWGTTFCEVEIPEGVSVKSESDNPEWPEYSAPCIRLGKIQQLTGSVISSILLAAQHRKLLNLQLLRDMMGMWGMKLSLGWTKDVPLVLTVHTKKQWKAWKASRACPYYCRTIEQQYEHDKSSHEAADEPSPFPPFTPPSKFHRKTAYRVTLKDVAEIASTIQKLMVVRLA